MACRQALIQANWAAGSDPGGDGGKAMGFMADVSAMGARRVNSPFTM
jgi:hypothetical protein